MRKQIFTLSMTLMLSVSVFALDNILLDDFENGLVNFTEQVNVNPPAHMDVAVVDNPVKDAVNSSNKVWEWKRFDASPDPNQPWAGFWATLKNEVPTGYHRIEIKFLRKNSTSQLRIKCEGAITKEFNPVNPATKVNEWETLVFDLTENGIKNIKVIALFPDYYEPVDPTSISYIDDITIIYDSSVVIPPTPAILTLFSNSASDRFHDQSWVNQTAPSTVLAEHWEGPSVPNGDKMPVVTTPVKSGANALKLQWKSVETGDWKALTAAIGWSSFDLTDKTNLKFWINSPVALAKSALPKVYLEAHSGSPNATGKVDVAAYLNADLVANTWTEVVIPLADLWAADAAFVAKDVVKGVFFAQNATDNVEHTLFMDDFTFERVTPPVMLFENSANDRFHDQSWSFKNAPSTLVQEHWEGPSIPNGDKLPCVTSPVKSGANALKLQWKSVETGDWAALVAAIGWTSFDLTEKTHISLWINSPVALAKNALPKVHLEAHSGNPNATGKVMMGDYLTSDLDANTWTEVKIALVDIWAVNNLFEAKGVIKGVFFSQNSADNVEHTLYMDDISFIVDNTTLNINSTKVTAITAYYSNGELRIKNYDGIVRIFDLTGKNIATGIVEDGKYNVSIQRGIYIVNTNKGSVKIAVR